MFGLSAFQVGYIAFFSASGIVAVALIALWLLVCKLDKTNTK